MNNEHVISDEILQAIQYALVNGENWLAYNTGYYFLESANVAFFKSKDEAHEFAENNISDYDAFKVLHFNSVADVLKQIPYGNELEQRLANPDINGLYNRDGNAFTDALIDHLEKEQIVNNQKHTIMNEKNYDYLKDQLKNTGFGEGLQNELKDKMEKQTPEFQLDHNQKFGRDEISATLHFKKSDESDMYFFNKYDLNTKPEKGDEMHQTFYVNKGNTITLKEAYNLMEGRAVNKNLTAKDGEKYNAWVQMDFKETDNNGNFKMKQFHQNYGYNLEQALAKLPIKELAIDTDKNTLMQSLQKGNRQAVTFMHEGKEQRQFIEANPQYKTITVYDGNMQRVNSQAHKEKESTGESTKQEAKKDMKNKDDDSEGAPVNGQKSKKKRGVSIS